MTNIQTITVGPFEVNCYLLFGEPHRALVVDPGAEPERIADSLARHGVDVAAYLVTHGHVDHVGALPALWKSYPAPVYMHEMDARWAFTPRNQIPPYYEAPVRPMAEFRWVTEHSALEESGLSFRVIETPGHTPGSVCYWFRDLGLLFSGDTLFAGSVGRTDLLGGSARVLSASLRKLVELLDETRIYPGHGPPTTLAREKQTNMFLRGWL